MDLDEVQKESKDKRTAVSRISTGSAILLVDDRDICAIKLLCCLELSFKPIVILFLKT